MHIKQLLPAILFLFSLAYAGDSKNLSVVKDYAKICKSNNQKILILLPIASIYGLSSEATAYIEKELEEFTHQYPNLEMNSPEFLEKMIALNTHIAKEATILDPEFLAFIKQLPSSNFRVMFLSLLPDLSAINQKDIPNIIAEYNKAGLTCPQLYFLDRNIRLTDKNGEVQGYYMNGFLFTTFDNLKPALESIAEKSSFKPDNLMLTEIE